MENNERMKIIFLDIDGVMLPLHQDKKSFSQKQQTILGEIIRKTNASLVISSSWRRATINETKKHLSERGFNFCDSIIDITPRLNSGCRGLEINQWLNDQAEYKDAFYNEVESFSYLILDDEPDMIIPQLKRFLQVNCYTGLTPKIIEPATQILNTPFSMKNWRNKYQNKNFISFNYD